MFCLPRSHCAAPAALGRLPACRTTMACVQQTVVCYIAGERKGRCSTVNSGMRIVGYVRVSSQEQADSGAGLEAQRAAITEEAQRRGWELVNIYEDAGSSGSTRNGRPGLEQALAAVESVDAAAVIVSKLDRLSRSTKDFADLMDRSQRKGWNLVALDVGVDTTTPQGEFFATVLAGMAQWERRIISQRTKDALAVKKAQGVKLGNPTLGKSPPRVRRRIRAARTRGDSYAKIAAALNRDAVPTSQGGSQWWPASVRAVELAASSA